MEQPKTTYIKRGLIALSAAGNVGLAVAALYLNYELLQSEKNTANLQERQAVEEKAPHVQQRNIILTGSAFRKLSDIDWNAAIMSGNTVGALVTTPESQNFSALALATDTDGSSQVSGTFLQLINEGVTAATNVKLVDNSGQIIRIGTLPSNITKLILIEYETRQPYKIYKIIEPMYIDFEYEYLGRKIQQRATYIEPSSKSWIPTLDSKFGVGSAVFEERNKQMKDD